MPKQSIDALVTFKGKYSDEILRSCRIIVQLLEPYEEYAAYVESNKSDLMDYMEILQIENVFSKVFVEAIRDAGLALDRHVRGTVAVHRSNLQQGQRQVDRFLTCYGDMVERVHDDDRPLAFRFLVEVAASVSRSHWHSIARLESYEGVRRRWRGISKTPFFRKDPDMVREELNLNWYCCATNWPRVSSFFPRGLPSVSAEDQKLLLLLDFEPTVPEPVLLDSSCLGRFLVIPSISFIMVVRPDEDPLRLGTVMAVDIEKQQEHLLCDISRITGELVYENAPLSPVRDAFQALNADKGYDAMKGAVYAAIWKAYSEGQLRERPRMKLAAPDQSVEDEVVEMEETPCEEEVHAWADGPAPQLVAGPPHGAPAEEKLTRFHFPVSKIDWRRVIPAFRRYGVAVTMDKSGHPVLVKGARKERFFGKKEKNPFQLRARFFEILDSFGIDREEFAQYL